MPGERGVQLYTAHDSTPFHHPMKVIPFYDTNILNPYCNHF